MKRMKGLTCVMNEEMADETDRLQLALNTVCATNNFKSIVRQSVHTLSQMMTSSKIHILREAELWCSYCFQLLHSQHYDLLLTMSDHNPESSATTNRVPRYAFTRDRIQEFFDPCNMKHATWMIANDYRGPCKPRPACACPSYKLAIRFMSRIHLIPRFCLKFTPTWVINARTTMARMTLYAVDDNSSFCTGDADMFVQTSPLTRKISGKISRQWPTDWPFTSHRVFYWRMWIRTRWSRVHFGHCLGEHPGQVGSNVRPRYLFGQMVLRWVSWWRPMLSFGRELHSGFGWVKRPTWLEDFWISI